MRRAKSTLKVLPFAALLLTAATALAVRTQYWNHQTEQDFSEGNFENTVINSYGELTLGRELKTIALGEPVEMVVGIAGSGDGAMYAATTPDAKIFRIAEGKVKVFFQLPEAQGILTTIGADGKGVLLGTSNGKHAKLLRLDADGKGTPPRPVTVFEKEGVENIWSILSGADGALYVGTGPKAQVYKVAGDGAATLVLDAGAGAGKNIVSLALDKQNRLIAGTDGTGLVIRAGAEGKPFVLHDAGAVDITALVLDDAGNLYAAASKGESGGPNLNGMEDEGAGTKSKPGTTEPEPVDLPDDEPATKPKAPAPPPKTRPAVPATGGHGMAPQTLLPFGVLADKMPELSPELQALLQKVTPRGSGVKDDPTTRRKHPPTSTRIASPGKSRIGAHSKLRGDEGEGEAGNAVYKIAPDGSVTTIFTGQESVMALLWHKPASGGELLIGTGTTGRIFSYTPADQSQALVARVKEETVTALALGKDGTVFAGASNMGQVYTLSAELAKEGTYTSKVLDAARSADWGRARITTGAADKGSATFATRTGNVQDVEKSARFWSDWTAEAKANDEGGVELVSPKARYLQYRVTLKSGGGVGTPTVSGVKISYQVPNLPPKIKELSVESEPGEIESLSGEASDLPTPVTVTWDATDPNHDTLTYRVYYRAAGARESDEGWTLLAKDLKASMYDWTTTAVADGKYQVKVVASDAADNPVGEAKSVARVSPAFVVNHTPAVIGELKAEVGADGRVTVTGSAKDTLSPIAEVRMQVSGQTDWTQGKAADGMFDSLAEAFTATTRVLPAGAYRLTVRVTDTAGNSSYKAVTAKVP